MIWLSDFTLVKWVRVRVGGFWPAKGPARRGAGRKQIGFRLSLGTDAALVQLLVDQAVPALNGHSEGPQPEWGNAPIPPAPASR